MATETMGPVWAEGTCGQGSGGGSGKEAGRIPAGRRARRGLWAQQRLPRPSLICGQGDQVVLVVKNPPASAGDLRGMGSVPGSGRSLRGGHGNPLQYSCLETPKDREAWWATDHGVTESDRTEETQHAHVQTCRENTAPWCKRSATADLHTHLKVGWLTGRQAPEFLHLLQDHTGRPSWTPPPPQTVQIPSLRRPFVLSKALSPSLPQSTVL